ncbi:MAG: 6-phosphogluconolactonase [Chloroflexi bacterium]|nr:6-phosphogluconolactonase [Chloroflexota bacterium]
MIEIFSDTNELYRFAAEEFVAMSRRAIRDRGQFLAVLPGGTTPLPLFDLLSGEYKRRMDWTRTHFFWTDERCVPSNTPDNNYFQARMGLFDKIDLPEGNIHRILTDKDPQTAAGEYAKTLESFAESPGKHPAFDFVLLGMGEDGHTASLFPNSPVDPQTPTLAVDANYRGRPSNRITLTPVIFNQSRYILFIVTGSKKAPALLRALEKNGDPVAIPARRIQPLTGELHWIVDREAAVNILKNKETVLPWKLH